MRYRWMLASAIVLALLAGVCTPLAYAQSPFWDRQQLEAFLDPIVTEGMAENHIPGAALVVVKDGEILLSKGYGYANLEHEVLVDPRSTVFQAMSVSKLFTATAIMQLVEQGRVDLDADVNGYLTRYQVPPTFGQPVTVAHLLTHTAGFDYDDDGTWGAVAPTYEDLMSLSDYLVATSPRRAWPPGERRIYSNAAFEVLGLVVEEVSGQGFADYVDAHILAPLGMARTSFRLPHPFQDDAARHYAWEDDHFEVRPSSILHMAPAATIAGPAEDMAAFMIAHLQGGEYRGTRILQEATARQMQATQFTYHPTLAGQAFGFIEALGEGLPRDIHHDGGDPRRLCSLMTLLPDEGVGFYIVQNADDGCAMIYDLRDKLMASAYPRNPKGSTLVTDLAPPAGFEQRAGQYVGVYRFGNYFHKTVSKVLILEWQDLPRVTAPGDGTLEIVFNPGREPFQYVEVGPHLFALLNYPAIGARHVAFVTDDRGRVAGFSWGSEFLFEKVPWYGRIGLHKVLFVFFGVAFLLGAAGAGFAMWRVRRQRLALGLAALTGLLNVLAFAEWAVLVNLDSERQREIFAYYLNPLPGVVLAVDLLLTSVLAVVTFVLAAWLWRKGVWSAWGRLLYTAFSIVAVAFVPFLGYWNLLGFQW